jgi:DNA-binding protein
LCHAEKSRVLLSGVQEYSLMMELPVAPVIRIVRKSGAERVSSDAGEALAELMAEYGAKISKEAVKLASHAGRKTITAGDIRMAADILS